MKRARAVYSGSVQGVGFRFTAVRIADEFGIKGWVKNLPNGDVEIAAEGREETLEQFLSSMEDKMSGHIQDKDISFEDAKDEFNSFNIKY